MGCADPVPLLPDTDTGIFHCRELYLWRQEARLCPSGLPRDNFVTWPAEGLGGAGGEGPRYTISADECSTDADCGENGSCSLARTDGPSGPGCGPSFVDELEVPEYRRLCTVGCREDADCEAGAVCVCGSLIGQCQPVSDVAGCRDDSDCREGFHCLSNGNAGQFGVAKFACQLPGDACNSVGDCLGDDSLFEPYCVMKPGGRICESGVVCGRPFLVDGEGRTAVATDGASWLDAGASVDVTRVVVPSDAALRVALAEHWTHVGLLEHASVAAFARFTLQLLSLGAPAELVHAATAAQADETRHAELAFALASRYAGKDIGPGALPLDGALNDSSFEAILRTTILEGCMGETHAALEAAQGAEACEDPVVRRVLETIATDEARHAELAWRVVRWMVTTRPELARIVAEELVMAEDRERLALRAARLAARDLGAAPPRASNAASPLACSTKQRSTLATAWPTAKSSLPALARCSP